MEQDIRWEQRFSNYVKALQKLDEAVAYIKLKVSDEDNSEKLDHILDEMLKEGLIQRFEYTYELACNVMLDYSKFQGRPEIRGNRDAIREAFQLELITDGKLWMDMITSRNKTSHTYNETTANEIYEKILDEYHPAFIEFEKIMDEKRFGKQEKLF